MAPSRRSNKKTTRYVGDDEEEKDIKRRRTDDAPIKQEDSQDPTPEPVVSVSATGSVNAVAVTPSSNSSANNNNSNNNELPSTTFELAEVLCNIVSDRYSRDEKLCTLERLHKWAQTEDGEFLKLFHACSGVLSVLNFIKKTMNNGNCVGQVRMDCIEKAAQIIIHSTYSGTNKVNKKIATKIVTSLMECDGINTLINASEEYNGGEDVPQLKALRFTWGALNNITSKMDAMKDAINKYQAIALFDTGIDIISQLKSIDGGVASGTLGSVFGTLYNVVFCNYVTKKYLQDKDILSKYLEVFKKDDGTWTCRSEIVMAGAITFINCCRSKKLLDKSSDYEIILPLLVIGLKKYPTNDEIRRRSFYLIGSACSTVNDRKIIETSGVMEALVALLVSDAINEAVRDKVRALIRKIIA